MGKPTATESPIARRIRDFMAASHISQRKLSARALGSETHLHMTLKRLDEGQDVAARLLEAIAVAMGVDVGWLITGVVPSGPLPLRSLPTWPEVSCAAATRYRLTPEALAAVGEWIVPGATAIDAAFVGALARAWEDARAPRP
jgi:hypothetical protein